jgi:hypothetical protein
VGRVWNVEASKKRPNESEIDYGRRMALRHGVTPWALVYIGDALRELAEAIRQREDAE